MAYLYSHSPDFEIVDLNKDVPPPDGTSTNSSPYKNIDDYLRHVSDFEKQANEIRDQRTAIYDDMKSKGASGKDIFNKIIDFNKKLPSEYLRTTGLDKYF